MLNDREELEQFSAELFQEIRARADEMGEWTRNSLFSLYSQELIEIGEMNDAIYIDGPIVREQSLVDGYCGDPLDSSPSGDPDAPLTLGLIITDLHEGGDVETLGTADMNKKFNNLLTFVHDYALNKKWRNAIDPSTSQYELADLIATRWDRIAKIQLYLLTNKKLSNRVDGKQAGSFLDRSVSYSVWDLSRFMVLRQSKGGREELAIDFATKPLRPLRALLASAPDDPNPVYLAAIPGEDLARIYDRWGTRLLEQNVRVFLQARSNVNKGIKNTIQHEPELFFSFNNGITATAEKVTAEQGNDGLYITSLSNLQIVNGGQTTASIYAASQANRDLSKVFVQMKLSIVDKERAEELVPRISEYANSQNKVSQSDLFANHPYHVRIENFSRRILAPTHEGSFTQSKWFYERARGQYNDQQLYKTPAQKKEFLTVNPKSQKFTKTDLAKYEMVWTGHPYFVNRGAQKNFAEFAKRIAEAWSKDDTQFNEHYYRSLIAKKIIWDETEKLIPQMEWYETGGYRAPHVVFTIGLLSEAVRQMSSAIDFERIWREQEVDKSLRGALKQAANVVHRVLMNPAPGYRNISEWAKQLKCWEAVKSTKVEWNSDFIKNLLNKKTASSINRQSVKLQKETDSINYTISVVNMGSDFWKRVHTWLIEEGEGSEKERACVAIAAAMPYKTPSERQSAVIVRMMQRIEKEGCPYRMKMVV